LLKRLLIDLGHDHPFTSPSTGLPAAMFD
jgi:hypothetical protein